MDKVKVVCRVRPLSKAETSGGGRSIVEVRDHSIVVRAPKPTSGRNVPNGRDHQERVFSFDNCYFSTQRQRDHSLADEQEIIYREVASDTVGAMLAGYNACILAYGQSGTGKTFTMMGTQEEPGIIPRLCFDILNKMKGTSSNSGLRAESYSLDISFLEIYNERVRDLLSEASTQPSSPDSKKRVHLRIREHPKHGAYVQDLSKHSVTDASTVAELLRRGNERRVVAQTDVHDRSSRSHAILTIYFSHACVDGLDAPNETRSKVHLVDLAGSERLSKESSKARMVEGSSINKSLVTLSSVIAALSKRGNCTRRNQVLTNNKGNAVMPNGSPLTSPPNGYRQEHQSTKHSIQQTSTSSGNQDRTKVPFVPYRDSVLTRLLKDCLGGNSKTTMIATLSPASTCHAETITTLRYAQRAKHIINCPRINEDSNARLIRELRMEIQALRSKLNHLNDIRLWSLNPILTRKDTIEATVLANEERAQRLTQEWIRKHLGGAVCEVGVQTIGDHGYGGAGSRMDGMAGRQVDNSGRCSRSTEPSSSAAVSPTSSERTSLQNTPIAVDYDSGTEMSSINRPESPYTARNWCYACRKQQKSPEPVESKTRQRKLTRSGNTTSTLLAPIIPRRVQSTSPCGKRFLGNQSSSLDVPQDGGNTAKSPSSLNRRRVRSISSPDARRAENVKKDDRSPFGSNRSLNSVASVASTSKLHSSCHTGSYQSTTFSFTRHMTSKSPVPSNRTRRRGCQVCSSQESCSDMASSSPDLRSRRATGTKTMTKQEIIEAVIKRLYPGSAASCPKKKRSAPARLQSTSSSCSSTACHEKRRSLLQPPPGVKEKPNVVNLGEQKCDDWEQCLISDVKPRQHCLPRYTRFHSPILDSTGCLSLPMTSIPSVRIGNHEMTMSDDSLDNCEADSNFEKDSLDGSDCGERNGSNNSAITYAPIAAAGYDVRQHCWLTAEQDQQLVYDSAGADPEPDFQPAEASEAIIERVVTLETHAASNDNGNGGGTQNCDGIYDTTAFSAPTCDSSHRRPLSPVPRLCRSGDFRANFGEESPNNCINIVLDYSITSPTRLYTIAESNQEIGSDMSETDWQDRFVSSPHLESDEDEIRQENQLAEEAEFSNPVFHHSDVWKTTTTSNPEVLLTPDCQSKPLIGLISNEDDNEVLVITGLEDTQEVDVGAVGGVHELTVPVPRKKSEKTKREAIKDIMAIFGQVQGQIQQQISQLEEHQAKLHESVAVEEEGLPQTDDPDSFCEDLQGKNQSQLRSEENNFDEGSAEGKEVTVEIHGSEDKHGHDADTFLEDQESRVQESLSAEANVVVEGRFLVSVVNDSELLCEDENFEMPFGQCSSSVPEQIFATREEKVNQDLQGETVPTSIHPAEYSDSFCEDSTAARFSSSEPTKEEMGDPSDADQECCELNPPLVTDEPHSIFPASHLDRQTGAASMDDVESIPEEIEALDSSVSTSVSCSIAIEPLLSDGFGAVGCEVDETVLLLRRTKDVQKEVVTQKKSNWVDDEVEEIRAQSKPCSSESSNPEEDGPRAVWGEYSALCDEDRGFMDEYVKATPDSKRRTPNPEENTCGMDSSDPFETSEEGTTNCDEDANSQSKWKPLQPQLLNHGEDGPRAVWGHHVPSQERTREVRLDPFAGTAKYAIDDGCEVSDDEPEEASRPYESRSGSIVTTQLNTSFQLPDDVLAEEIEKDVFKTEPADVSQKSDSASSSIEIGQPQEKPEMEVEPNSEEDSMDKLSTECQTATSSTKSSIEGTSEPSSSDGPENGQFSEISGEDENEGDIQLRQPNFPHVFDSPEEPSSATFPATSSSEQSGGENTAWLRKTRQMASIVVQEVILLAKERVDNGPVQQAVDVNGCHQEEAGPSIDDDGSSASEGLHDEAEDGIFQNGDATASPTSSRHASPPPNTPLPALMPEVVSELRRNSEARAGIDTIAARLSSHMSVDYADDTVIAYPCWNSGEASIDQLMTTASELQTDSRGGDEIEESVPAPIEARQDQADQPGEPLPIETGCVAAPIAGPDGDEASTLENTEADPSAHGVDCTDEHAGLKNQEQLNDPVSGPLAPNVLQTEEGVFPITCADDPFANVGPEYMDFSDLAELAQQIMRENDFLSLETIPEMSREEYSLISSGNPDSLHSSANALTGLKSAAAEETEPEFAERSLIWVHQGKTLSSATSETFQESSSAAVLNTTKILQSTMSQLDYSKSSEFSENALLSASKANESCLTDRSWDEHFIEVYVPPDPQSNDFTSVFEENLVAEIPEPQTEHGTNDVDKLSSGAVEIKERYQRYLQQEGPADDFHRTILMDDYSNLEMSEDRDSVDNAFVVDDEQVSQKATSVSLKGSYQEEDFHSALINLDSPEHFEEVLVQSNDKNGDEEDSGEVRDVQSEYPQQTSLGSQSLEPFDEVLTKANQEVGDEQVLEEATSVHQEASCRTSLGSQSPEPLEEVMVKSGYTIGSLAKDQNSGTKLEENCDQHQEQSFAEKNASWRASDESITFVFIGSTTRSTGKKDDDENGEEAKRSASVDSFDSIDDEEMQAEGREDDRFENRRPETLLDPLSMSKKKSVSWGSLANAGNGETYREVASATANMEHEFRWRFPQPGGPRANYYPSAVEEMSGDSFQTHGPRDGEYYNQERYRSSTVSESWDDTSDHGSPYHAPTAHKRHQSVRHRNQVRLRHLSQQIFTHENEYRQMMSEIDATGVTADQTTGSGRSKKLFRSISTTNDDLSNDLKKADEMLTLRKKMLQKRLHEERPTSTWNYSKALRASQEKLLHGTSMNDFASQLPHASSSSYEDVFCSRLDPFAATQSLPSSPMRRNLQRHQSTCGITCCGAVHLIHSCTPQPTCCHGCHHGCHGSCHQNAVFNNNPPAPKAPTEQGSSATRSRSGYLPSPSNYLKHLVSVRRQIVQNTRMLGNQRL